MKQKNSDLISLLAFSKIVGVSEKTIRKAIISGKLSESIEDVNGKPKIHREKGLKEYNAVGVGLKSPLQRNEESEVDLSKFEESKNDEAIAGLDGNTSMATAARAEKIFKAQKASLEVQELSGTLVKKEIVYSQLFKFGNELKKEFQSIPDRITDDVASSTDRSEVNLILTKAINDALMKLSEFNKFDFKEN